MLASFVITARESLEASLLIGILLAYLARADNRRQWKAVWLGAISAGLLSVLLAAAIVFTIGMLNGWAQETLDGVLLIRAQFAKHGRQLP